MVTLDECEEEFWKILSNMEEQVSVEYGADLHTLETGSGFPTRSYKGKLSANGLEYLDHPWNLNNLSRVDKSVLSQMNVEISGMKVRWCLLFCVFFLLLVSKGKHACSHHFFFSLLWMHSSDIPKCYFIFRWNF